MRPLVILITLAACLSSQDPIRVTVTLVQVDAIVTNKAGKHVKDLTKEDFEVFADGKPRPVSSATYIESGQQPLTNKTQRVSPTTTRVQREKVTRTIALLVDDLKMAMESVHRTRLSLHKFVDSQITPGDLIAILCTSGGIGALQQFTTDRRLLHKAIDRLSFQVTGAAANTDQNPGDIAFLVQRRFAVGPMSAIKFISAGMRNMPGRKSIVLLSDGFALSKGQNLRDPAVTVSQAYDVANTANNSAVTLYAIDTRGLKPPPLQAQEDLTGFDDEQIVELLNQKRAKFTDDQKGLSLLAVETGGLTRFESNDIPDSLSSILQDQSGYYLISFPPNADKEKHTRLQIRLKRPGLTIRYRKSALIDPAAGESESPKARLFAAVSAPFTVNDIPLRVTPVATLSPDNAQWQLGGVLHINCANLSFSPPDPKGIQTAVLHILSITEGETPSPDSTTEKTYTIRATGPELEKLKTNGLVYSLQSGPRKSGAYQIRVAVMDNGSGFIGATSAFVDLPDLAKSKPTLSTLNMADESELSPAIRKFQRGKVFAYSLTLFNSKQAYDLQPRLISNGKVIWEGNRFPVALPPNTNPRRIPTGGILNLSPNTTPGEYTLEVLAIPRDGKSPTLSQWTDFNLF